MTGTTMVSEAVARPLRTAIQMTPAAVVTELIDVFVHDLDERGYTAIFGALTLLFAAIQNWRENATGTGWWLRAVPPESQPLTDTNNVEQVRAEGAVRKFVDKQSNNSRQLDFGLADFPDSSESPYKRPGYNGIQDGDFE
jgi:hypothetical protein